MKVIINVKKGSAYAKYNGLTFPVVDCYPDDNNKPKSFLTVALNEHAQNVDFNIKEISIVDLQTESQSVYDAVNWNGGNADQRRRNRFLSNYIYLHKIKFEPVYNCLP